LNRGGNPGRTIESFSTPGFEERRNGDSKPTHTAN